MNVLRRNTTSGTAGATSAAGARTIRRNNTRKIRVTAIRVAAIRDPAVIRITISILISILPIRVTILIALWIAFWIALRIALWIAVSRFTTPSVVCGACTRLNDSSSSAGAQPISISSCTISISTTACTVGGGCSLAWTGVMSGREMNGMGTLLLRTV
jgi:hypothetical protein